MFPFDNLLRKYSEAGWNDEVKWILDRMPFLVNINSTDAAGNTALMLAAKKSHSKAAKELVLHGANVNLAGMSGETPLMCSAQNGDAPTVEILLSASQAPNINAQDRIGKTALMYASEKGHIDIVNTFLNREENAADVNIKNNFGLSALMLASRNGCLNVVKALLPKRANINDVDGAGNTALIHAAISDNLEIMETLIKNNADVNAVNKSEKTALEIAYANNNPKMRALPVKKFPPKLQEELNKLLSSGTLKDSISSSTSIRDTKYGRATKNR